jgi:hypothetical protein
MFKIGDLVVIAGNCDISHFKGNTAIVIKNLGQGVSDHSHGFYYEIRFPSGNTHIFKQRELILLSRPERKDNENR